MALTRYRHRASMHPWENMRNNLNRLFRDTVNDEDWPGYPSQWAPMVDINENKNAIIMRAEMPGVKKEDLEVSVDERTLTICGEKKDEHLEDDEGFYRSERSFGHFCRHFSLPHSVDSNGIKARYNDGILKVSMPKIKDTKRQVVDVE
ncbi:MAG: Hsp20 family protein [candidate division Zixibacteria bacterium]|nr:Hsp20 family protein [candidate division Zixibacteria bacterium]